MPVPPLLVMRHRDVDAQVYRLTTGTTLVTVGDPFGVGALESPSNNVTRAVNRVIQFGNNLFAWQDDRVFRIASPYTGAWVTEHTQLNPNITYIKSDLHVVNVGGLPTLMGLYRSSLSGGADISVVESTDGLTWSESSLTTSSGANTSCGRSIQFRNEIFWQVNRAVVFRYDPNALSTATTTGTTAGWHANNVDFCVYKNRLFAIADATGTTGSSTRIYEIVGNAWQDRGALPGTNHGFGAGTLNNRGDALWQDGTNMYAILFDFGHSNGHAIYQISGSTTPGSALTRTDISGATVPTSLASGGAFAFANSQWGAFTDNDTNPASPTTYLFQMTTDNPTNAWFMWEWNGPSSLLTGPTVGPTNVRLAMPQNGCIGGGNQIFTEGELDVRVENTVSILGGEQISFRAYGDVGPTDKIIDFFYGVEEGIPTAQCTLTGAVTGGVATRNNNQVEDVQADDGATLYTAIWDTPTDGINPGDRLHIMARIS